MGRNWVQIWLRKRVLGRVSERFGARLGTKVNVYWGRFLGGICTGHGAILRVSGGFGFSGEELADGKRKRSVFK
jgi:hypothetical protein